MKQGNKSSHSSNKTELVYDDDKLSHVKLALATYTNDQIITQNIPKNKDLIPGQYEGGVKIWECSLDLAKFLPGYVGWFNLSDLIVLELGCGHGIPGIYFALRGSTVLFQDFNQEVLDKITKSYLHQLNTSYKVDLFSNSAFISGDWKDFTFKVQQGDFETREDNTKIKIMNKKFDIILSSDTIYNLENYETFYNTIKTHINNPGICFISSKKFYFGVGGGTSQFMSMVQEKGEFDIKVVKEINDGMSNIRQILEMRTK